MTKSRIRFALFACALFAQVPFSAVSAQEHSAVRNGFSMPAGGTARILLLRPSIKVGAQSTGGMFEPRAEWTDQARQHLGSAIAAAQGTLGNVVVHPGELSGDDARLLQEYHALFGAVARSVINYQFFKGNRLETKKRDNREGVFEWTLGPGVANIPGAAQADYALFIITEDHYGSTGRKIFQILAAASVGYSVPVGLHAGYAGLVDLRTGNLVWINADNAMGGDVREAEGAQKRVGQLLEEFPGRAPVAAAKP